MRSRRRIVSIPASVQDSFHATVKPIPASNTRVRISATRQIRYAFLDALNKQRVLFRITAPSKLLSGSRLNTEWIKASIDDRGIHLEKSKRNRPATGPAADERSCFPGVRPSVSMIAPAGVNEILCILAPHNRDTIKCPASWTVTAISQHMIQRSGSKKTESASTTNVDGAICMIGRLPIFDNFLAECGHSFSHRDPLLKAVDQFLRCMNRYLIVTGN